MKYVVAAVLCCAFLTVIVGESVRAWSWTDEQPTVYKNEIAEYIPHAYCPSFLTKTHIEDIGPSQELCVFGSSDFRFATSFLNGGQVQALISYSFDSSFHRLSGVCKGLSGCVYSDQTDTLVARYNAASNLNGLKVFDHVRQRIQRSFFPDWQTFTDTFNTDGPQYVIKDTSGNVIPIGGIALSENGRWLVFEILNRGIGRLDIETGELRRVGADGIQYGAGMNPTEELAVSNSGTEIAQMGDNTGLSIIHITPSCGDSIVANLTPKFALGVELCPVKRVDKNLFTSNFYAAYHPTFSEDGGQLTFYSSSTTDWGRRISLRAHDYQGPPPLDYLAMGDSFSSGEGEDSDGEYLPGTNEPDEKCHVSRRSYPFLLRDLLFISALRMKSVACAGAITEDIIGRDEGYMGQGRRLAALTDSEIKALQGNARLSFQPGRIHQETFLRDTEPTLLTVGIGGNDAGFMAKLKKCAMPGTCEWAASPEALFRAGQEIRGVFDRLLATYRRLMNESPHTKLFAVGYPEVIFPEGTCDPVTTFLLDEKERTFMQTGVKYLNQIIQSAAQSVDATYIDIEHSLEGYRLCEESSQSGMNGLRLGDDASILSLSFLKIIGNETFHPTPFGHSLIANYIMDHYGDLFTYTCSDDCFSWSIPEPPNDWRNEPVEGVVKQQAVQLIDRDHIERTSAEVMVQVPVKSFVPDTALQVMVDKRVVDAGIAQSNDDGGMNGVMTIPNDLPDGFYTVHVFGTSYNYQPVDLYQVISFGTGESKPPPIEVIRKQEEIVTVDKNATIVRGSNEEKEFNKASVSVPVASVLGVSLAMPVMHVLSSQTFSEPKVSGEIPFPVGVTLIFISCLGLALCLFILIKRRLRRNSPQDPGG